MLLTVARKKLRVMLRRLRRSTSSRRRYGVYFPLSLRLTRADLSSVSSLGAPTMARWPMAHMLRRVAHTFLQLGTTMLFEYDMELRLSAPI